MPKMFESINVSAQTSYPVTPQAVTTIVPGSVLFINESADVTVYFSFDGVADHGKMIPNSSGAIAWEMDPVGAEYSRIWLKRAVAGGVTATVTIMIQDNF